MNTTLNQPYQVLLFKATNNYNDSGHGEGESAVLSMARSWMDEMRWMMDESGHEKANGVSMNATVLEYSKID